MQLKPMRKEITSIIDDIKYHSDSLTDLDRLPILQLKIILSKINKLNEKTTILLHYIELASEQKELERRLQMLKEEEEAEVAMETTLEAAPELEKAPEVVEENIEIPEETKAEEVTAEVKEEATEPIEEPKEEIIPEVKTETQESKVDTLQPTTSVGENLNITKAEELSEHLHRLVTTDLNSAIGINERYLFTNELFNNNLSEYSRCIDELNNCEGFDRANQLLDEYSRQFHWDHNNQHVVDFCKLVERRYS